MIYIYIYRSQRPLICIFFPVKTTIKNELLIFLRRGEKQAGKVFDRKGKNGSGNKGKNCKNKRWKMDIIFSCIM